MFSFLKWFTPKVEKSELSNPDIHIVPYGFYKPHYILLDTIAYYSWFGNPEFTSEQLNQYIKSADRRASDLWKMWFLNVRVEKFRNKTWIESKRHYYSINKKWREALLNFNHKF